MDLKEEGCGGMEWIYLAQDRDRWYCLSNRNQNELSKFPPPQSIDMSDHRLLHFFKVPGTVALCFTGVKIALVQCFHFELELNTIRILYVPTDKI
jgi:hypothetical protein